MAWENNWDPSVSQGVWDRGPFLCTTCVVVVHNMAYHVVHKDGALQAGTLLTLSSKPVRSDRAHRGGLAVTQCLELFLPLCRTLHRDPS